MSALTGEWDVHERLPDEFLSLAPQVYADDPHWIPEDPEAVRRQFSAAHAWFEQGKAWVGVVPQQARLAGFFRGETIDGEPAAFFGFWESVDALAPNERLFAQLKQWARAQGARRLYGPINFTTFGAYRVRLDGFDQGAFPGEPRNPAYYPALLERLGMSERHRYLSTFDDTDSIIATVKDDYLRVKPKLEKAITFEPMSSQAWMGHLDELYGFVENVFGSNFAYTPISRAEFEGVCGQSFADKLCPQTSVLARARDGRIAGFFLVFPDYSALLRQGRAAGEPPRMTASEVKHLRHAQLLPRPRLGLAKTGGVHPDFQSQGLFTAMGCELSLRAHGVYEQLAGPLVRADNNSRQFAMRHGRAWQRHYGLYQLTL